MTQQFDLALNMASTTDKMMFNNSSTSYSNKENNTDLNTQFGNFLDNANKNYTKTNTQTSKNSKSDNNVSYKKAEKNDIKSEKKEVNSSYTKTEDKSEQKQVSSNDNTSTTVQISTSEETNNAKVNLNDNITEVKDVEEIENIDEILQDSILVANLSDAVKMVSNDSQISQQMPLDIEFVSENVSEIPVDAIKSGIKFETNLTDVDIQDVDTAVVDNITQDMSVRKEDLISSLYDEKTGNEQVANVEIKAAVNPIENDVKADTPKLEVEIQEDYKLASDVKIEDVKPEKVMVADVKSDKTEKVQDLKLDEDVKTEIVEEFKNVDNSIKLNEVKIEVETKNDKQQEVELDSVDVKSVKNDTEVEDKTEIKLQNTEIKEMISEEQFVEPKVALDLNVNGLKTDIRATEPVVKIEELKQEIDSAKLENVVNNVPNQTDKKIADKDAKTNVDAKETMDIEEDVAGIEFVDNDALKKSQNNTKTDEVQVQKTKTHVENVKIQVEENVKINPQLVKTSQDENKIVKAQETLDKAGLSTENLQKIDAKITEIDNSKNNSQSDLGQSSQEMMIRDMLQNSAQSGSTEAIEVKTDFNQTMNKMLQQTSNVHQMQQPQEIPDVDVMEQIRSKMVMNGQNGMQKITIGLTPESLGKLQIEISKGMNGISAQILADNPQAKEILDRNLENLKSILQSQGVNVSNVNVKVAEAGRSSDSNNNLFNSNENSQFNSNNNGNNSKNSEDSDKEKYADFEHFQTEAMKNEDADIQEETKEPVSYQTKTVEIKASSGNIKYQL